MTQSLTKKYPGRSVRRDGNQIVVTIPVKFYRRNGRQMVSARNSNGLVSVQSDSNSDATLVAAIAKAWAWQEELESGQYSSLEELAQSKSVDRSYAGRILKLTSLSPDIVELILVGNTPEGISLRQLRRGIQLVWSRQI